MHNKGQGVPQDFKEAVHWLKLAAAQGNARAQNNLAGNYALGDGLLEDLVKAHMWANLATMNGSKKGAELRDLIAKSMTQSQIVEAQKMARECLARDYKMCN
jgi:TPR repeat protein